MLTCKRAITGGIVTSNDTELHSILKSRRLRGGPNSGERQRSSLHNAGRYSGAAADMRDPTNTLCNFP